MGTSGAANSRVQDHPIARRSGHAVTLLTMIVLTLGFALPATSYADEATTAATSSTTPAPSGPTPTTHSYDDSHTEQQPVGSSPALWILAGALAALVVIAVILIRTGRSSGDHAS